MKQIEGQMSLFDILEPENAEKTQKEPLKCGSCIHMRRSVWGLMEYHGWACFGFGISYSQDPQQAACDKYEPKGECSSCKYRVWLHWDGKAHKGCDYAGGGFCKYERREDIDE